MHEYGVSQILQSQERMIYIATVLEVDHAKARARVSFGENAPSHWLHWTAERAGETLVWAPPSVGEQVVVVSPGGNTANAVILGSIYSAENGPPANSPGEHKIKIGASSITITDDEIVLTNNGSTLRLNSSGISLSGAEIRLN